MPLFKMIRDALPPAAVSFARPRVGALADRIGDRYSFDTHRARPDEREGLLSIVDAFLNGPVPDQFRSLHGVDPCVCLSITSVRRQKADTEQERVGWHVDLNFVGDGKPFLVAWTAVEDVGKDRVGLDVCVPTAESFGLDALLREHTQRLTQGEALVFSDADLDNILGPEAWACRSVVAPAGAAAVFDQFILHRSQVLPTASRDRHSIEFRMMDDADLPAVQKGQPALYAKRGGDGRADFFLLCRGERKPMSRDDFTAMRIA